MIKFTASGAGGVTLIGLGLESANITRLEAGQPIRVRLSELGFTGAVGTVQIMIFAGENTDALEAAIRPFIGPETVIHRK